MQPIVPTMHFAREQRRGRLGHREDHASVSPAVAEGTRRRRLVDKTPSRRTTRPCSAPSVTIRPPHHAFMGNGCSWISTKVPAIAMTAAARRGLDPMRSGPAAITLGGGAAAIIKGPAQDTPGLGTSQSYGM
jgi:hypothetical protein